MNKAVVQFPFSQKGKSCGELIFLKKNHVENWGIPQDVRPGYRCGLHAALTRTIALEDAAMHATPPVAAPSHSPKNKSCFTFP
jgi:hypothetical protein